MEKEVNMETLLEAKKQLLEGIYFYEEFKAILIPIDLNGKMEKELNEAINKNLLLQRNIDEKMKELRGDNDKS